MAPWLTIIVGLLLVWLGVTNKSSAAVKALLGGAAPKSAGGTQG